MKSFPDTAVAYFRPAGPLSRQPGRDRFRSPLLPLFLAIICWLAASVAPAQDRTTNPSALTLLQSSHRDLQEAYFTQLRSLQNYCATHQLQDGVQEIARYLTPPEIHRIRLSSLPRHVAAEIPLDLAPEARHWRTQLQYQRQEYAKQLYLLSRRALHAGFPSYAFDLIRELILHDPDHARARELLGFVRYGDEWMSPFARKMLLTRYEKHPRYGWLPKNHIDRYNAGERFVNGRWMSADKEAAIRQDFDQAWEIQTDHYLIRTNYSLERGVELGEALEDFYDFFHQAFAGFFNDPEQLKKLFDGTARSTPARQRPYQVNYYRSRDEYVERLRPMFPAIQATNGLYLTDDRTAHFYYDPMIQNEDTLFHEATHQLFYESHLQHRPIATNANFWIVEVIACYLESFRRQDGEFTIGDPAHIRFAGARMNFIDRDYYVPLREFTEMGSLAFQSVPTPQLAKNYTQAAGMAHFFMHYDGGRYRDATVAHLAQIYSVDSRKRQYTQGLDELTGVSYADLDKQYAEWLKKQREADVAQLMEQHKAGPAPSQP